MNKAFSLTLKISHIRALLNIAGKDDIRYYLNGIAVECGRADKSARLIATNGHCLGLILAGAMPEYGPQGFDGVPGCVILPRALLEQIKKPGKRDSDEMTLRVDGPEFTLEMARDGVKLAGRLLDGKFPDYRRVIPQKLSGHTQQFDPDLLMRFSRAAECLGSKSGFISIGHNGAAPGERSGGGALIEVGKGEFIGVCMEMRADPVTAAPGWVSDSLEPEQMKEAA